MSIRYRGDSGRGIHVLFLFFFLGGGFTIILYGV